MDSVLKGKRAIVTGSTSGIGLGIAECLAGAGCDITLNGFGEQEAIEAVQRRLADKYGVRVLYTAADMSKPPDCLAMVERVRVELGQVDILVNNAGIQYVAPLEEFPAERWDAIIAVNLSAAFHLTAAVLHGMRSQGYGRIVNIASVHGLVASKNKSAYVVAKHGLIGLTKVTALETANQGITCNAICPGWVQTPLVEAQITARMVREPIDRRQAELAMLSESQPSGEFVRPDQIGALVVFLCSDSARSITGASLPVDGGWTAR